MANVGQAVDFVLDHWQHPGWLGNPWVQFSTMIIGLGLIYLDKKRPALFALKVTNRQMIIGGLVVIVIGVVMVAVGIWQEQPAEGSSASGASSRSVSEPPPAQSRPQAQTQPQSPVASAPLPTARSSLPSFPNDKARLNEALVKIHGIIKPGLLRSIDQFHGGSGLQSFEDGPPGGGYGPLLARMKQRRDEIETAEAEIKAVLDDSEYSYLSAYLTPIVTPSPYRMSTNNYQSLDAQMRNFLNSLEVFSQQFPNPDGRINSVLVNQGAPLQVGMTNYTNWARQTVAKIEEAQKELNRQ
jgi:hypothetical protein